jgi:hypothetical protein
MEGAQNDWILESLSISQDWNKKAWYTGSCKFRNGIKMELALKLDNENCIKMIRLLQEEIESSAKTLGNMLVKYMPLQIESPKQES